MEKILKLFVFNNKLKFNEIEKLSKIRSNKLAYYLKKLVKEKTLKKENGFYYLNEDFEYLIPYIDSKISVLPVVLIALTKGNKIFLTGRNKKPYKDKLSLPGGRIVLGEDIKKSVKRIMKKYNINANLKKINSVSLEQVKKKRKIVHTFLLIFVSAETKDEINYVKNASSFLSIPKSNENNQVFFDVDIEKNKKKIISSDYKLIKNDLKKEIKINEIFSKD